MAFQADNVCVEQAVYGFSIYQRCMSRHLL